MATTQAILQAVNQMQASTQEQLPVIPNNGNPAGANNMPSVQASVQQPPAHPTLPWMQPSQHMTNVQKMLQEQAQKIAAQQNPMNQTKFNVLTDQNGFRIQPLTDQNIPMDMTPNSLPMQNPYMVPDPNTGQPVLPASYRQGR